MTNYNRSYEELERRASKFWPSELSELESKISIIPLLLKTQDKFISIIGAGPKDLENLFNIIQNTDFQPNVFVKHLVILADFGGEMLKRISNEAGSLFPNNNFHYFWQGKEFLYTFKEFPKKNLNNHNLEIEAKCIGESSELDDLKKDAIALLLFGKNAVTGNNEIKDVLGKCEIGGFLGKPVELQKFIKERYIWVSRITGGTKANNLGQLAQQFVFQYLSENLTDISLQMSGRLPGVTHTDPSTNRSTSFDIVLSKDDKYLAIEVSFQVTTNSTIERKAGQARNRYEQIIEHNHEIAYVIDGAGNFEREVALRTICNHSHCSVAFSRDELEVLCQYVNNYFN